MGDDKILEKGKIARHCKPSAIKNRKVLSAAFELRKHKNEEYLSSYLLDNFKKENEKENIKSLKEFMERQNYSLKPTSGFAVLDIEETNAYVIKEGHSICIKEKGLTHCGIFPIGNDLTIAKLLADCVNSLYKINNLAC